MNIYYLQFLKGEKWLRIKLKLAYHESRRAFCCEGCGRVHGIVPHHWKYPSNPQQTKTEHLMWLCRKCHTLVHKLIKAGEIVAPKAISSTVNGRAITRAFLVANGVKFQRPGKKLMRKARREYIHRLLRMLKKFGGVARPVTTGRSTRTNDQIRKFQLDMKQRQERFTQIKKDMGEIGKNRKRNGPNPPQFRKRPCLFCGYRIGHAPGSPCLNGL